MKRSSTAGAVKNDIAKPPMDLLSTCWLEGVARVMGFGAKKYAKDNWRKGMLWSRLIAACLRHLLSFNDGEDRDPESGESHLLHASCCLMMLYEQTERGDKKLYDRYKPNKKETK